MATSSTSKRTSSSAGTLSAEERAALKERTRELKAQSGGGKAKDEKAVLDAIAAMSGDDKAIAERIHVIVTEHAPDLAPKTYYGMPGYAKDGKVMIFFQSAAKFSSRYPTLGFNENAALDDGSMWPTSFAITSLTKANEKAITDLVKRAVSS